MNVDIVAVTYARALLELAKEKGELEDVREEVQSLLLVLEQERDIRTFVESPRIGKEAKTAVVEKTLRGKYSDRLVNLVQTMVAKGRESFLAETLQEFKVLYDVEVGLVRATVTTPVAMAETDAEAFRGRLETALKKKVELENQVDESLLGGFVLRYEGMVADASLKSALDEMGERMLSVKFGSELIHEN